MPPIVPRVARWGSIAAARSAVARVVAPIRGDARARPLEQLDEEVDPRRRRGGEPHAEVGQALADEALGRVDEQDRRLEAAAAVDQLGFLRGVLEVVAGVRLVGDQAGQVRRPDGQVGVDVDPRAAAAVEPVVGAPRLVADERDPQVLAVRAGRTARRPRRGSARRASRGRRAGGRPGPRDRRPRRPAGPRAVRRPGGARRSARPPRRTARRGSTPACGRSSA